MIPGVTRGALKTILMLGAGLFLLTEILKELSFSNSLNGEFVAFVFISSVVICQDKMIDSFMTNYFFPNIPKNGVFVPMKKKNPVFKGGGENVSLHSLFSWYKTGKACSRPRSKPERAFYCSI